MQYVVDGEDVTLQVFFKVNGDSVIPDVGSVTYTVKDNSGTNITDLTNLSVTTDGTTVAIFLTIVGANNALSGRTEVRTVVVKFTIQSKAAQVVYSYRVVPYLNFTGQPEHVRSALGVNGGELPDDDIDLVKAYFLVENDIGQSVLEGYLSSGTISQYQANDAIVLRAALLAIPSLQLRVAKSETTSTMGFTRFDSVDLKRLAADISSQYGELTAALSGSLVIVPIIATWSTQPDPYTGV